MIASILGHPTGPARRAVHAAPVECARHFGVDRNQPWEGYLVHGQKKRKENVLKRWGSVCLWKASLDMWWELKKCRITKKNPSHGSLKMMFLAALGITVVQAEKYLINSLA